MQRTRESPLQVWNRSIWFDKPHVHSKHGFWVDVLRENTSHPPRPFNTRQHIAIAHPVGSLNAPAGALVGSPQVAKHTWWSTEGI